MIEVIGDRATARVPFRPVGRGLSRRRPGEERPSERMAVLTLLEEQERTWRVLGEGSVPATPAFDALRRCADRLGACLTDEVRRVHPVVRLHLPAETGTMDVVREEQATLEHLVTLLGERLAACKRGEPGAGATVGVVLHDLVDVWRTHVRRFDQVIDPLLRRLKGSR